MPNPYLSWFHYPADILIILLVLVLELLIFWSYKRKHHSTVKTDPPQVEEQDRESITDLLQRRDFTLMITLSDNEVLRGKVVSYDYQKQIFSFDVMWGENSGNHFLLTVRQVVAATQII